MARLVNEATDMTLKQSAIEQLAQEEEGERVRVIFDKWLIGLASLDRGRKKWLLYLHWLHKVWDKGKGSGVRAEAGVDQKVLITEFNSSSDTKKVSKPSSFVTILKMRSTLRGTSSNISNITLINENDFITT